MDYLYEKYLIPVLIALFFIMIFPCSFNLNLKFLVNAKELENSNRDEWNKFNDLWEIFIPSITR